MSLLAMCWLWRQPNGRTIFRAEHVNIWAAMLRRHCTLDLEIACVTNMPEGIDPSIRIIEPPGFYDDLKTSRWRGGRPSCYRRLVMFSPDAAEIFGADRFVAMDLDCVIGGNIDAILDRDEECVICGPSEIGERWIYNGSMMMLTAGARAFVYEDFTPERAEEASRRFVGSDQAWLAYSLGRGEATWDGSHGVMRWPDTSGPLIFFPGTIKPWSVLAHPFIAEHYRLNSGRKAIILGEKAHVWTDAAAAKSEAPFDEIIALPRAASEWKHKPDHIAEDMRHALRLAHMLGCDETIICGG